MPEEKRKLNADIPGGINDFESIMKTFRLKDQIFKILFRGKGLEFEGFRDFAPDDDASNIDWKTSARAQKLVVKQYKEERDLKIMFLIDVGSNMVFGSTPKLKCEYIAEMVGALAHLAVNSNDRIGFFFFSDKIQHYVEAQKGIDHFGFFMDLLLDISNYGGKTNLDGALDFAMEYFDKSISSVILISDFLNVTQETEKKLSLISSSFETILIKVKDPLDLTLPDIQGEIVLEDPSTGEQVIVNPKIAKVEYERYAYEQEQFVENMFSKIEADTIELVTSIYFAEPLALFLKERSSKNA